MSVLRVVFFVIVELLYAKSDQDCAGVVKIPRTSLITEIFRNERGVWESRAFLERLQDDESEAYQRNLLVEKSYTCAEGSASIDTFVEGYKVTPSCDCDIAIDKEGRRVINMGEDGGAIDSRFFHPKPNKRKNKIEKIIQGTHYVLFRTKKTWSNAYCDCKSHNLHLAVPNTLTEIVELTNWWKQQGAAGGECIYLGFTDMQERGALRPVSDDVLLNYTIMHRDGGCGCLSRGGFVTDINCEKLLWFICERYGK